MWFSTEGEQRLKDSYTTDETLACTEKALQHFNLFLAQSKVLQQYKHIKRFKKNTYRACLCFISNTSGFPLFSVNDYSVTSK